MAGTNAERQRLAQIQLTILVLTEQTTHNYLERLAIRGFLMSGAGVKIQVKDLIDEYRRSVTFKKLAHPSKLLYEITLNKFTPYHSTYVHELHRRDVLKHLDTFHDRPGTYRIVRALWGILFRFAVDRDYLPFAPVLRIDAPKTGSYRPWTPEQVRFALTNWPEPLRRVVVLAVLTSQRRGDLIRMTWSQYDGFGISLTQGKTGTSLYIPSHQFLKRELELWRVDGASEYILECNGRPWNEKTLSRAFRREADRHSITKGLVLHGLRKTAAILLSESSCTIHEIAAITGHKTLAMIAHYTKAAEQLRLSRVAIEKLNTTFLGTPANTDQCLSVASINQL